ncbi:hypothetical protein GCM10011342_00700 [Aquisalinus flavus]|uniref:Uncharacterized protein n=1 Tax=Aquisalinus flavus TaxID=1526572 RepID=A0A8J2V4G1_9PROT|nr:hypothetical protein GCM10011342_00700 [Aquisalinus flavus]
MNAFWFPKDLGQLAPKGQWVVQSRRGHSTTLSVSCVRRGQQQNGDDGDVRSGTITSLTGNIPPVTESH